VHSSKASTDKLDGDVLAIGVECADEATLLVGAVKGNLNVALHELGCEAVSLWAVRLRLLSGTTRRARRLDAREHKRNLGMFLREKELEPVATRDKVDDGGMPAATLP
jgi:hypothetical protein